MKERPILFSTEMVKAILEGRKAQTRRIIKPQPFRHESGWWIYEGWRSKARYNSGSRAANFPPNEWNDLMSSYGRIGDRLWVRETWARTGDNFHDDWPGHGDYYFRADDPYSESEPGSPTTGLAKWRPSIFMPREACRIMLEVTDVRVERLQSISEEDAKREGVHGFVYDGCFVYENYLLGRGTWEMTAKSSFCTLWSKINGHKSWEDNHWVWVISFKKL